MDDSMRSDDPWQTYDHGEQESMMEELEGETLVIQRPAPGYCSICCRPIYRNNLISKCRVRCQHSECTSHWPLEHLRFLKFSHERGGWAVERSIRRASLCLKAYRPLPPFGDPNFLICYDCIVIVSVFLRTRTRKCQRRRKGGIYTFDTLYQCLRHQFFKYSVDQESSGRLLWSHNAFIPEGVEWIVQPLIINRITRGITHPRHRWVEAEAMGPAPSLPKWFLSMLRPLTEDSIQRVSLLSKESCTVPRSPQISGICNLPTELIVSIAGHLELPSVFCMREICYRFSQCIELNQWFWYTRFVQGELFGFIPKHESHDVLGEIKAKAIKRGLLPDRMDWMRLIKQVSTFSSFSDGGCLSSAPDSFRNHRRIWKILETIEMETETEEDLLVGRVA